MDSNQENNPINNNNVQPKKQTLAIISFVFSILSIILFATIIGSWIFCVIGLILAIVSLVKKEGKKGLSIASIIIDTLVILALIPATILGSIFMAAFTQGFIEGVEEVVNNEVIENTIDNNVYNTTKIEENAVEENDVRVENTSIENKTKTEKTKYKTEATWYGSDIKTFVDYDYTYRNYILLRVETKEGDLEAGEYVFRPSNVVGTTYLIYITDEPISDLGTYAGHFDMIQHGNNDIHTTHTATLKKGQYVYIVQGDSKKGSVYIEKTN